MRKSLYALSATVVAGIASVLAQEVPRLSFGETLKFILFGDLSKSAGIQKREDGSTLKLAVTVIDEKNCTTGMSIQYEKRHYGDIKATFTLDFKAVLKWQMLPGGSDIMLDGSKTAPVVKSLKLEWLRTETDEQRKVPPPSDAIPTESTPLPVEADKKRAEEAIRYLLNTLCPNPDRAAP